MNSIRGYLFILGASLFWGISATIAQYLLSHEFDTLVLVQMRMTISCLLLLTYFIFFKRHLLKVRFNDLYRFALLGVIGLAGSNFTYYFTIKETNVATAIILQYMAPLLVLAYAALSKEEELNWIKLSAGVLSLTGCFFAVTGKDFSIVHISQIGLITGIASAFCWSFTNVWLRHLLKVYTVWTCLIYSFIFASIFWLFFNPPWNLIDANYTPETWGIFWGFAILSILIPHSFYYLGLRYLTPSRAIITATFEPVIAILSAYIFLDEILAPIQIIGAVFVIIAIGVLQLKKEENLSSPLEQLDRASTQEHSVSQTENHI